MDSQVRTGSAKPAAKDDLSGSTLGDFRLERRLGQGGMGQVYLAEQLSLCRKVAVKVMRPEMTANPTALKRFQSEAMAIARITHPNIVQVYTSSVHDGMHYIALEFVDGTSLGQYLTRKGPLPIALTLKILKQVAAALAHAGEQGIVHRDIKPENILITKKADAKVTDFGLARSIEDGETSQNLTQSGVVVGTPVYMSPEQIQGKKPDCRTDIYSLGITAYYMLAGRPPFKGESAFELALQHVQSPPPSLRELRLEVTPELEAVVLRMMAKAPEDRFANGRELLRALAQLPAVTGEAALERKTTPELDVSATPYRVLDDANGTGRRRGSTLQLDRKKKKKGSSLVLWLCLGLVALFIPLALAGAFIGYRMLHAASPTEAPQALGPDPGERPPPSDRPPPDRPPDPPKPRERLPELKPDAAEEARLRGALTINFSYLKPRKLHEEVRAYVDLAGYYLRTGETVKAEKYFTDLRASGNAKPQVLIALGEAGAGILLSQRGDSARSNEAFLQVVRRPQPSGAAGPRVVLHAPQMKPLILDALDRNAKAGPLPPELRELRNGLEGR